MLSSSAHADDPVITDNIAFTGWSAFADHDRHVLILLLTRRTKKRRPPVLHDALDGAAAARRAARLAFAVVNAEVMLKHAEPAVGQLVVAQRRAAVLDGVVERALDGVDQPLGALVRRAAAAGDGRGEALG